MAYPIILVVSILIATSGLFSLFAQEQTSNNYQIAYNVAVKDSAGNSNYEVFAMHLDGSHKRNITNHPDVAWSYDAYKDRLFFISDRDTCYRCFFLYEMDIDGNHVRKISELQLEDSWMSSRNDGEEMIVSGRIGKMVRYQLFIINTLTGHYTQLTTDTAARYLDPCFSPDGTRIAFSYKANKRDRETPEEIYVMPCLPAGRDASGSDMRRLSHYPEDNISQNQPGYRAGATKWHPTENFISYISMQDGRHGIYAVTPDGSSQWKLTDHDFATGWHDWSPDGKWLVFAHSNDDQTQFHFSLMDWATKESIQLSDNTYQFQHAPVFVQVH